MSTEKGRNANLAPGGVQDQGDKSLSLEPQAEHPVQDSRTTSPVIPTQRITSIGLRIIGPLKSSFCRKAIAASELVSEITALTSDLEKTTGPLSEEKLATHEDAVLRADKLLYELEALMPVLKQTAELPEIGDHRVQLYEHLLKNYEERSVNEWSLKLTYALRNLKFMLRTRGHETTEYVPSADKVCEAHRTPYEVVENQEVEPQLQQAVYPISNSSDSLRASDLSGMLYDETQVEHTVTTLINIHDKELRAELNRVKNDHAERKRQFTEQMRQMTEKLASLNKKVFLENSLLNELSRVERNPQKQQVTSGTQLSPLVQNRNLPKVRDATTTAIAAKNLVQSEPEVPVHNTTDAADISSKPPTTAIALNQLNEILQAISRLERQAQKQNISTSECQCESEEDMKSNHYTRTSLRAQRKSLKKPQRSSRSGESDLESSHPSDDEESRTVSSGSENAHDDDCRHPSHSHKSARHPKKPSELPELITLLSLLPKYDGTGEEFHDTFPAGIMSRRDLTIAQQYIILHDHLIGSAGSCVATSKDHSAAIKETFENLRTAFGLNLTKDQLLQKFSRLSFHQSDPDKMRQDMASFAYVRMLLQEQGVAANDENVIKVFASKLPHTLREGVLKLMQFHPQTTIDDVIITATGDIRYLELEHEVCELATSNSTNEIPIAASINYANGSASKPKRSKPVFDASSVKTRFHDTVTKTSLPGHYAPGRGLNLKSLPITFPFDSKEPLTCPACSKAGHSALRCKRNSADFRNKVEQKQLCPLCLSPSHTIANCKSSKSCIYCGGKHHTGGCPKKESYRDLANYPKEAKPRQTLFREKSKTTQSK